ncbi:phosphoglycerate mutase-like protein [Nadsonia fulvescens var. elongata DSM 6958]|uniref:Phosphoglycerate mutase-like protein n=1 Tax=Nadsonia fulvescens var. elongata DSM 6958 TaxID=857566 RepID=A0A1E3PEM9_9ASCO|nr:phosphoglycerate mutase-like protein [Nadsonia fulvescens var. elongata DSM 6958]
MVKTIYIARHAFRANWVADYDPQSSLPTGIAGDIALARPYGLEQSAQLAEYLNTLDPAIQRVYSSPFVRCIETCKPFVEKIKVPIFIENGVSEWYRPDRKGGIPIPAKKEKLAEIFSKDLINVDYNPVLFPSPKGETFEELKTRVRNFFTQFIRNLNENESELETILITTHAATKIILAKHLVGDENATINCGTCSVDKYIIKPDVQGSNPGDWICLDQGYTDFLTNGEEMNWTFENFYEVGTEKDLDARRRASGGKLLSERDSRCNERIR